MSASSPTPNPNSRPRTPKASASSSGSTRSGGSVVGGSAGTGAVPAGAAPVSGLTAPTTRPHGPTTRTLLQIQWDYPVYAGGPATRADGTPPSARSGPLPVEEALRFITRDDPRPLLVVRECRRCNRTDRALLTPGVDNEKTILLSRWFHCVKLTPDVSQPDHPLHALFPRDDAEHLFVSAADGSGRMPLEAVTSRTDLWAAMGTTLARAYAADPTPAYKQLAALIDGFDLTDQKLIALQERRSHVMESERPDPAELRSLESEIERLRSGIARDLERVEQLPKAELQPKASKSPAAIRPVGS